jgi:hypothetical protein
MSSLASTMATSGAAASGGKGIVAGTTVRDMVSPPMHLRTGPRSESC